MATYFVDPAGNDNNNGTSSGTPWASLNKVNTATLVSGDIVQFKRGATFSGVTVTAKDFVTYQDFGSGAKPVFNNCAFTIGNKRNVTIKNLQIQACTGPAIHIDNSSQNITVEGCTLTGNGTSGQHAGAQIQAFFSSSITVKSTDISNGQGNDCLYFFKCPGVTIELCNLQDGGPWFGDNVQLSGCDNFVIKGCTLGGVDSGKGNIICSPVVEGESSGGIIQGCTITGGNYGVALMQSNVTVSDCTFIDVGQNNSDTWPAAIWLNRSEPPTFRVNMRVHNCLFRNSKRHIGAWNELLPANIELFVTFNTFIGGGSILAIDNGTWTGEFRRNIIQNTQPPAVNGFNGVVRSQNFWEGVSGAVFGESGSITGTANLNVTTYIPNAGSPAIGYGYSGVGTPIVSPPPSDPANEPQAPGSLSVSQIVAKVNNQDFKSRIQYLCIKVARQVFTETPTVDTPNRKMLANRVFQSTFPYEVFTISVLADANLSSSLTANSSGGTAGTDAQLEQIIDNLFTLYANAIANG
jgi:hypothetical protein